MRPLFDELFPVTENDVQLWLDQIPNLSKSTFRREAYRKAYHDLMRDRYSNMETQPRRVVCILIFSPSLLNLQHFGHPPHE